MKRYKLLLAILIPALLILFSGCDEKIIRDDCADLEDIGLVLTASYFTDCNPNEVLPAHGAGFKIMRGSDTIFSGNLDENGRFDTGPIDSSSCGMNNVIIETSFNGKSVREKFGIMCCDTTLTYQFGNVSCNPPDTVDCMSIDTTIVKTITSSGDCVMQNATLNELKDNSVIISSVSPVRIELDELLNLTGKIYVESMNPRPSGKEIILKGSQFEIYFNVDRSELGAIQPVTINLPTYCLDSLGNNVNSGTIKITIDASICDPHNCYCPFGESKNPTVFYAPEDVSMGENKTFDFTIAELSGGVLEKGCILKIDSIKRADGTDAYTPGVHSWVIKSISPNQLTSGDKLTVSANFAPVETGLISEDFQVFTSLYSEAEPNKKQNSSTCSFLFSLRNESCEINCPQIQILGFNTKLVDRIDQAESQLFVGSKIDLQDDKIIRQKINARMSTKCLNEKEEPCISAFKLDLPDGYYCSDINLSLQKKVLGATDDTKYFYSVLAKEALNKDNLTSGFGIYFDPPDLSSYYSSNHDSLYQCGFELEVTDEKGNEICRQEIQIIATVFEFSLKSGDIIPMEAFSQVSNAASIPSYHVYAIDVYNSTLGNYGLRESLTPNFIDFSRKPNTPLSAHSIYFDVDHPDNPAVNFTEKPKLYLINTPENKFSRITATPVATYSTPDEFFREYENGNLMRSILNNPSFSGTPDNFYWNPQWNKSDFYSNGGLEINPYEVYVVWDPDKLPDIYYIGVDKKRINCGMALLYISSVKTGDDNTDPVSGGNGKASVSFYVEYPVKY